MSFRISIVSLLSLGLLAGCASSKIKERKELREKIILSSKIYCEFVNGEVYPDIDVALNLEMSKRCDSEKPFSLTSYKTVSETPGVLYCCSMAQKTPAPAAVIERQKAEPVKSEPTKSEPAKQESKSPVAE